MVLEAHGLFTWGATAKDCYGTTIEIMNRAIQWLDAHAKRHGAFGLAALAPLLRPRDLAEGNANRVQSWLDRVAETDAGEAMRLWLQLLRFVTPQLAATAIADITPKSTELQLASLTDAELEAIIRAPDPPVLLDGKVRGKTGPMDRVARAALAAPPPVGFPAPDTGR